jgi:hypothetical protein
MRIIGLLSIGTLLLAGVSLAQGPSFQLVGTMSELMVNVIHPASNEILMSIYRGAPKDDKEWAAVQRSALVLAESGNLLLMPGRVRDQGDWVKDSKLLVDVGTAAYKAARAKDAKALAALDSQIDATCTTCHKQYRPNVYPK